MTRFFTFWLLLAVCLPCLAQTDREPMSEKEFEQQIQKAFEERDRLLSKPQTIYYSPVFNQSGTHLAYVKRTLEYRLKGGGLIPFLSNPPEVQRISDAIELCQRELRTGAEKVIKRWELPEPDNKNEISYVAAQLEFGREIFYNINLASYNKIFLPGGRPCRGSGFCISNKDGAPEGVTEINGRQVRLDHDPERERYPSSNNIIVE